MRARLSPTETAASAGTTLEWDGCASPSFLERKAPASGRSARAAPKDPGPFGGGHEQAHGGGGGGGGGSATGTTPGGQGGGGNGGGEGNDGVAGQVNTGGGGGGGRSSGGQGGSGVVILRVPTANYPGTTTGSPTVTEDGDFTVIKFTGSGTYET